jgi:hypothetical protein
MISNIIVSNNNLLIKNINIDIQLLINIIQENNYFDILNVSIYNFNTIAIDFSNSKPLSLKKYINNFVNIDYSIVLPFFKKLSKLFNIFNYNNISIINFNINDFIYINQKIYFIAFHKLQNIKNNFIFLDNIIEYSTFNSPDIALIKSIPTNIHYKSFYFSLAVLLFNFYNQNDIDFHNLNKLENSDYQNKVQNILLFFQGTPFYYFIKRILPYEPINRSLVFI